MFTYSLLPCIHINFLDSSFNQESSFQQIDWQGGYKCQIVQHSMFTEQQREMIKKFNLPFQLQTIIIVVKIVPTIKIAL